MDVSSTTNAAGADSKGSSALGKLNADFDLFLKLLTAQMQNQDPLDPMDTSQYTQQLVQYSQVEQQIEQSATLKDILAGIGQQGLVQASSLIGSQVEFDSDMSGLDADTPAHWSWTAGREAATVTAKIVDANDREVDTLTLEPGSDGKLTWDGGLSTGKAAPPGLYRLKVTATDADGNAVPTVVNGIGEVREVRSINGAVTLGINGLDVPATLLLRVSSGTE